jgi:glycogen(starch) synthase
MTEEISWIPSISIVVNTNGRRDSLRRTLESFRWLDHPNFEVCVVCGPTNDGSRDLVREYAERGEVKWTTCDVLNLSISRNLGIRIAAGDVVAFIDDDAVPEAEWLTRLAVAFRDPRVVAAGGVTHDHTGYAFQARYTLCDRYGESEIFDHDPGFEDHNYPFAARFPSLLGTNTAFRRSALRDIGGFDEEFDYYLDETDVCCRLNDRGGRIVGLADAVVHHKFLPSNVRNEHRFLSTPFPVLKNKIYFAVKHSPRHHRLDEAVGNIQTFIGHRRNDVVWGMNHGKVGEDGLCKFDEQAARAWAIGFTRGLDPGRHTRPPDWFDDPAPFRTFPTLRPVGGARTLVFLSQNFPPAPIAGNARHTADIARAMAAMGHHVHVLTRGENHNRVDLEEGVWVHRLVAGDYPARRLADGQTVPRHIWNHASTLLDEALRIGRSRRIDVVEGVSWDCETAAFVLDGRLPVATNIVTSLSNWLDVHPELATDPRWMAEFGAPMLALERIIFEKSDLLVAASGAILESIGERYDLSPRVEAVAHCPHGLEDMRALPSWPPASIMKPAPGKLVVLFVGRLEPRKGADILLAAAAKLLSDRADLEFWIAGDNTLKSANGGTEQQRFLATTAGASAGRGVRFLGPVDENELRWLYDACDVFVAPSRFESFGLIFVEAMMFAKPVIGCVAGGVPEVVEEGVSGLLVPPDDPAALGAAISRLADDPSLRTRLGLGGRAAYERRFAAPVVAHRRLEALMQVTRLKVSENRISVEGESWRIDVGGGEHGVLLDVGGRVVILCAASALHVTFVCHDWSGIADILVNGAPYRMEDLYHAGQTTRSVRVETPYLGSRVEIVRSHRKNSRSADTEVIIAAVSEA